MSKSSCIRKSGIGAIGNITWGSHISHIYSSKDEFIEVLSSFVNEGLSNNELCIFIYSSDMERQEIIDAFSQKNANIKAFLSSGQLIIVPHTEWYIKDGRFDAQTVSERWSQLIKQALNGGFDGVRAVGDTCWLHEYTQEFSEYERKLGGLIFDLPVTVICAYDMNSIDIEEFSDIIRNHSINLMENNHEPHILRNAPGIFRQKKRYFGMAKAGMRQKENIFAEILDNLAEGIYLIDYKSKECIYSEEWAKLLGFDGLSPEALFAKTNERVIPEDLAEAADKLETAAVNKQTKIDCEFRIKDKDGRTLWIRQQGLLVYDSHGMLSKGYGSFFDITERKQYENRINRQNMILRSINHIYERSVSCKTVQVLIRNCLNIVETMTESNISFIGVVGKDGLLRDIAARDSAVEVCKMYDASGYHQLPVNDGIVKLCGSVMKQGKSILSNNPCEYFDSETFKDHPDITSFLGVPVILDGKVKGIIAAANRDGGFSGENQEILEALAPTIIEVILYKKLKEECSNNETVLKTIIESTDDPIFLKDKENRLVLVNSAAALTAGKPVDQILGKDGSGFFSSPGEKPEDGTKSAVRFDVSEETEETIQTPQGLRTFLTKKTPWYDQKGNAAGSISIARDITARLKMERELRNIAGELDRRNKQITNYFINLSHEFKTPVSVMLVSIDMIENYVKMSTNGQYLDKITEKVIAVKQNAYRLTKLINNLLDIAKLNSGTMEPNYVKKDVVAVLKNLVKLLIDFCSEKCVSIRFISKIKTFEMPVDIMMLDRIMLNLISNALKYTGKGGQITIKFKVVDDKALISVKDNGEGIPDDKKDVIFDRFGQANTMLGWTEGTGLGLTLTKSLVEMMKGRIWFESKQGAGSEFFVELPVFDHIEMKTLDISKMMLDQRILMEFSDIV
ncbi:MAG: Alginate biosynthesis sensor protein KinB [Firmicutes bacterium ADurb.Bin182]|nr:MAG: Alginate biosynthesis sensor protein KinB [Firmicutes bacterium ADurb.Bin182]